MYDFLSYRPILAEDARLLLDWRRAPHVTRYMLTDIPDDLDRQRRWIETSAARDDFAHRIIQVHGRDVGYCAITTTDRRNAIGELGVYIGAPAVPRELTIYNFVATLNHAFFTLGLFKIVNHIVADNARTLRLQAFNGYRLVGVLKAHVLKDGTRHDLHIFEQTAAEWAAFRTRFDETRDWDGRITTAP